MRIGFNISPFGLADGRPLPHSNIPKLVTMYMLFNDFNICPLSFSEGGAYKYKCKVAKLRRWQKYDPALLK
jgi:hypothetical protein